MIGVFRKRWEVSTCLAGVDVRNWTPWNYYWKSIKNREREPLWDTDTKGMPEVEGGNIENKAKPLANQPTIYTQGYVRGMENGRAQE